MDHRALVNQREERGPSRQVQDRNHVHRLPRAPRLSGPPMFRHLDAKLVQCGLRLVIVTPQVLQDVDQSLCGVHADLVMQHGPPDLKHSDKVLAAENGDITAGLRGEPVSRPVLQTKVANGDGCVGGLLRRKSARLDGTSCHEGVREIGKLLVPPRIGGVVRVEQALHVRLDNAQTRRGPVRFVQQRSGLMPNDIRLAEDIEYVGDRGGRGGILLSRWII